MLSEKGTRHSSGSRIAWVAMMLKKLPALHSSPASTAGGPACPTFSSSGCLQTSGTSGRGLHACVRAARPLPKRGCQMHHIQRATGKQHLRLPNTAAHLALQDTAPTLLRCRALIWSCEWGAPPEPVSDPGVYCGSGSGGNGGADAEGN